MAEWLAEHRRIDEYISNAHKGIGALESWGLSETRDTTAYRASALGGGKDQL